MKMRLALMTSFAAVGVFLVSDATATTLIGPKITCTTPTPDCTKCLTSPASGLTWGVCLP